MSARFCRLTSALRRPHSESCCGVAARIRANAAACTFLSARFRRVGINPSSTSGVASRNIWPTRQIPLLVIALFGLPDLADRHHDRVPQPQHGVEVDFKLAPLEQLAAGGQRLDFFRQPFQADHAGHLKIPRLRHEILPGARVHRALEPLASTRQLTLNGSQRAAGKHYGRREQFQNIRRRQANLRTLFNRPSACDRLILSMLKRFRILIHLRIVALLRRKGMRDHLTRGNYPRGIPAAAGRP